MTQFFSVIRTTLFGGALTQPQVNGINDILEACTDQDVTDKRHIAYILATVYHEVDKTMQPIKEYDRGKGRPYSRQLKYDRTPYTDTTNIFYGRGHTQNTWYDNYKKLGRVFKVDLIKNPDLLITDSKLSAKISVYAMKTGLYTGKKLSHYFNAKEDDPINARRIINGLDKAKLIESYYYKFLIGLK